MEARASHMTKQTVVSGLGLAATGCCTTLELRRTVLHYTVAFGLFAIPTHSHDIEGVVRVKLGYRLYLAHHQNIILLV